MSDLSFSRDKIIAVGISKVKSNSDNTVDLLGKKHPMLKVLFPVFFMVVRKSFLKY